MTTTTNEPDDPETELDLDIMTQVQNIVCEYVGEGPAIRAVTLLIASAVSLLAVIDRKCPGTAEKFMPGLIRSMTMASQVIKEDDGLTYPSKRSH